MYILMKTRKTYLPSMRRQLRVSPQCVAITCLLSILPAHQVLCFVSLKVPSVHKKSIVQEPLFRANKKPIQDGKNKSISLPTFTITLPSVQKKRSINSSSTDKKPPMQEDKKKSLSLPTLIVPSQVSENIQNILSKLATIFPTLRTGFLSFLAGALITAASIFVPVYQSMDTLSQPVALFETILSDLDRAYVDKVDTNKLFETGIQAMLRSLDPYTEFEGKTEALELSESINGKYGGIGLVISGPVLPKSVTEAMSMNDDAMSNTDPTSGRSPLTSSDRGNTDDPNYDDADSASSKVDAYTIRREIQKARDRGIRVVSAFEGYAFDYGLRTGDKIVAIDGVPVDPVTPAKSRLASSTGVATGSTLMNVEQVRNKLRGEPGSEVQITFVRDGVPGENTVTVPRTNVQIRDVKLAALVGNPEDRIGYIQLTGFSGAWIGGH